MITMWVEVEENQCTNTRLER